MEDNYREIQEEDNDQEPQQTANKSSGLAVTSMILGICSIAMCMGPLTGLPAVICGHIARGKIKRGEGGGGGMALCGLITGYIGLTFIFLYLLILPAMLLPALSQARESARKISCCNNLKQIGLALRMYSNVYNEQYPHLDGAEGLEMLRKNGFLEAPQVYVCPSANTQAATYGEPLTEETVDYQYFGGHSEADDSDVVIACDKDHNHKRYGNALYVDGHVKGYSGSGWKQNARK
jgi:prepilin-type processing-associated H-X9-DG protein